MKIKLIAVLGLSSFLLLGACKGDANVNTNVNKMNTNVAVVAATPAMDSAAKSAVESALKGKGFTDVTVDATAAEVTLRGTVAKGKMGEMMQVAQETAKRKVTNQVTEK